jgi:cell wall assembly regulator SMI1
MQASWKRIEAWLKGNAPEILVQLLKGAKDNEISSAEKAMSIKFPADVKASYRIHNGQDGRAAPLMGEWQLLSLKNMVSQWKIMKKLVDDGKFEDAIAKPIGSVRADWYNPKWIPVAYNGAGDFHCLDLDPPPRGHVGQIISFWHMDEKRQMLAKNFSEWLETFANDLEAGKYKFQDGRLELVKKARR